MFTGLVEGTGRVKKIVRTGDDMVLTILPLFDMSDCRVGDSVSVDGVCLTVTGIKDGLLTMDVSGETISRSTMARLNQGGEVNLERALRLTDRLGGHMVSGHVDGTGRISKMESRQGSWLMRIEIDESLSRYTIEKGSVAMDGISLTINRCGQTYFEVNIIPQTVRETTILKKRVGEPVNIETDLIARYVEKFFIRERSNEGEKPSMIDRETLIKYGFGN